ncbi:YheC/YheD family protein [Paenibacillus sp. sgz500958]|uniref:YheC/YheD family endospore coat-associated protein n=1 Tax=Paenibacillus sp. sgz500958 TaxID=3242475 RepID=UPI0036D2BF0B
MTETSIGRLGIMTFRRSGNLTSSESSFYNRLCRMAPQYGLDVTIFQPDGVSPDGKSIHGQVRKDGQWVTSESQAPDIIYNRCFYESRQERKEAASALNALSEALPWSRGLPDKWGVHEILKRSKRAAMLLPETKLYTGSRGLSNMLAEREYGVFLKPLAGTHGKRTLHAVKLNKGLYVRGRDGRNKAFHGEFTQLEEGLLWIDHFIHPRRYLMQPYLQLTSRSGQPFDVRVLMQKDGRGIWGRTGMAVRLGTHGSLTSNLHGGATAVALEPFLEEEYGALGAVIREQIADEASILPPLLESACGRLGELGLDFGIDGGGRITLLEANSKPGRSVFRLMGDRRAEQLAYENPLRYARHLMLASKGIPVIGRATPVYP